MERRRFIQTAIGLGVLMHPFVRAWSKPVSYADLKLAGPKQPVFIYNNWSAYDELSDNKPQTEELAMRELNEIIRLKKQGVQIDYYVMDAFWFELWGGYRTWHKQHWPNGPDKWLEECKKNNIKPGMWFSTNLIATHSGRFLEVIPEWKDSLGTDPNIMCLFDGGYLKHLADTLQIWYDKGVRLFKFDFAYFEAVTPSMKDKFSKGEVLEKNKVAFMQMLQAFRSKNPDVLITGYNGFGGDMENTYTPFNKKIDPRWLNTFDTLYCGDPRFSDVPMMNIWRSQDNYSDHQVNAYKAYGMPVRRIDSCAFMIGQTGTCYYRAKNCWKGMLILELARGGWVNVYHGNLELLNNEDGQWFAKVQSLYHSMQKQDNTTFFGGIPGKGLPYGFKASDTKGVVCTVVNPSQEMATIELPVDMHTSKVLYADGGYHPALNGNKIKVGPEQLVVVGFGEYANEKYDMGIDETIQIPVAINKMETQFVLTSKNTIQAKVNVPDGRDLRIIMQQFYPNGDPCRSWLGAPPDGKKVSEVIKIKATQDGKEIPLHIEYDKMIWSGLSWGAAEIKQGTFDAAKPLIIQCSSDEKDTSKLTASIYAIAYAKT
ncbi:MAG TPA: hypothetical protein VK671_04995 [Mucilaginibacter sp.]|jgi:hypothetical protein|nr:hypothetical protein [Mucilaginibacter sp.]